MNQPVELAMLDPMLAEEEMAKQRAMADESLLSAIREREDSATGDETDSVNVERAQAIEYYLGRPFGNEIEGRSQVVSKDLFDTVEWIKPSLLRIFAAGDTIAEFTPLSDEDVKGAQQESDYVDHVIQHKNPWFMIAHEWFTDALLTKNAYAMAYWQDKSEPVLESYKGLTTAQLTMIGMDPNVQIVAHRAYAGPAPIPVPAVMQAMQAGMINAFPQEVYHDVDVRRVRNYGCAKICVLPPERCRVAEDAKGMSVRNADFFEYWEYKTISALRVDGFDVPDDIEDIGGSSQGPVDDVRDSVTSNVRTDDTGHTADPTMRKVKVRMLWIRNDYDQDGIAELRYVVVVGDTILANKEVGEIPVAAIVPYPMPHRHIGLSMYDVMQDLQLIKSAMLRAGIDNQFLLNNGRTAVDKNLVNLDDMQVSRPGGVVRVNGSPATALMPFTHPDTVQSTVGFIEYLDGIRQDRGGVSKPYAGADLDSIKAQPGTIAQLTSAASQKIELIARIFGEGVKELFQIVHEVTLSNPTVVDKVNLRGQWVTVDPRTWKKRSDMNLSVGMGVGNRQQQIMGLQQLLGLQKEALAVGLTTKPKIYTALAEYTKALGFASGKMFFQEPDPNDLYPQQSPPYQVVVAQIKAQSDVLVEYLKAHTDATLQQMKDQAQGVRTWFEENMQLQNDREERIVRAISEQTERMQEMRLENARAKGEGATVHVKGLEKLEAGVAEAIKAATGAGDTARSAVKAVEDMRASKPKKRKVTAPSGKTYTVEDA